MFTLDDLEAAAVLVGRHLPPTPQIAWPLLAARAGCAVWLKHENHTPTGAFKVRGGLVHLTRLAERLPAGSGLISATRGNHGQSLAYAAQRTGLRVTILVPHGNSLEKNAAMRAFGAELVEFGHDFQAAREEAERRAVADGLVMVPSFHPDLVLGVATYALEFLRAVPDLDTVYVPIGLGSGICGMIRTRDLLGLRTRIVGVVAAQAPAYALSFAAGHAVSTNSADTIADGMACRVPVEEAVAQIRAGAERIVTVSEDEIAAAVAALHQDTHNLSETAGAAGLAALLKERDAQAGRRIGLVLSGGNIDRGLYARLIA